jgi:hypothetical protein
LLVAMRCAFAILVAACTARSSGPPPASPGAGSEVAPVGARGPDAHGGRVGIHGMVVFGRAGHYYLEHIPMFRPPHDAQLVVRATLRDRRGDAVVRDLADGAYTLRPAEPIALDDLVGGKRTDLVGDLYRGSFERDGAVIEPGVHVAIEARLVVRPLPGPGNEPGYFVIGDGEDAYLTNAIGPDRPYQQILRVLGRAPARDRPARIAGGSGRLAPGMDVTELGSGLTVGPQLWCVVGSEFVDPCP